MNLIIILGIISIVINICWHMQSVSNAENWVPIKDILNFLKFSQFFQHYNQFSF